MQALVLNLHTTKDILLSIKSDWPVTCFLGFMAIFVLLRIFFLICYKDKEVLQLSLQVLYEAEAVKAKLLLRGFFSVHYISKLSSKDKFVQTLIFQSCPTQQCCPT